MAEWGSTCNHNYLYRWLPCQYFILLMMGAWPPKHAEKVCSNKICTLLHHVGVLFNLLLVCHFNKCPSTLQLYKQFAFSLNCSNSCILYMQSVRFQNQIVEYLPSSPIPPGSYMGAIPCCSMVPARRHDHYNGWLHHPHPFCIPYLP